MFYESEITELSNARALLASRYSATEAVHTAREQQKQGQLKAMSAITKKKLEKKYVDALSKLRGECNFQSQQCGALQQQMQQAYNIQRQMKEHSGKEAPKCVNLVAAEAAKREAQLIANMQSGTVELIFNQQLQQALVEVERAQQEVENWKGNSIYWQDKATQAEERIEEFTEKLAASGGRSGAETSNFSARCACQQKETPASCGLSRMFSSISPAPSGRSVPGASGLVGSAGAGTARESRQDDDELWRSFSSDDEDRKRNRRTVKPLVLDNIPNATGFRRWQFNFYFKVCEASRHDSRSTMAWIQQVEKPNESPM